MTESLTIVRDTCENWFNNNPILDINEFGYDITHNRLKLGDGVHSWNDMDYLDTKYNDQEIKQIMNTIIEEALPLKADKDDVYTKAEINNQEFITKKQLLAKNYMNKDEAHSEFLPLHEADNLATRKELMAHHCAILQNVDENYVKKSDTYNKIEIDKKIAMVEFPHCEPERPYYPAVPPRPFDCDCGCEEPPIKPIEPPCDERLFASVYVKGEVDALLEKKADRAFVNTALATKADKSYVDNTLNNDYYTIAEIDDIIKSLTGSDLSSFATKAELQSLEDSLNDNYMTKDEIESLVKTITGVDISTFATKDEIKALQSMVEEKADKAIVDEALNTKADKNDLDNAVMYKPFGDARKTIELANHNTISGLAKDGTGYNLAMVSKWDVADFGSNGLHMNLNSKDGITINDNEFIATVNDVESMIEPKADKKAVEQSLSNVYTKAEVDALNEDVKNIANASKIQVSDLSADLASKYYLKNEVDVKIEHLEDEIAEYGSVLTKLIMALEDKGIIDKGSIIVPNYHK